MKFKKLASLLVVAAMVFAMAVPAFASNPFGGGSSGAESGASGTESGASGTESGASGASDKSARTRSVQFTGTTKAPTIDVDVATSMDIILNPYKLQVTQGTDNVTDQLISSTLVLTNKSDCDIDICGTFTPSVAGGVALVKDSGETTAKATLATQKAGAKNVLLIGAVAILDAADGEITLDSGIDLADPLDGTKTAFSAAGKLKTANALIGTATGKGGVYPLSTAGTAVDFAQNKDQQFGTNAVDNTKGDPIQLAASDDGSFVGFRILGAANTNTSEAWTTADTVSVAMTLSITPQARTAS